MSTSDLQSIEGIGEGTAEKLMNAGIPTIEALASCTVARLVAIGIAKKSAMNYITKARDVCDAIFGFIAGDDLIKQFKNRDFLSSGVDALDVLLGGNGFETQKVYEIYGLEGTGKSNLLHQLVCTAYLPPNEGGLGAGAIYIDTEGTFSIKRIQQIAPRFGIDPDEISKNVLRAAPPTSDVLLYLCEAKLEKMVHQYGIRLICLDSIATHFRSEYGSERQHIPERQQKANKVIHALKRVAQQTNGVAILTNQATGDPTGIGRGYKHSMGIVVGHESQVRLRISVKSAADGLRKVVVEKALDLPPNHCIIKITDVGFVDENWKPPKEPKKLSSKKSADPTLKNAEEPAATTYTKKSTRSKPKAK
ncbi:MAG: helix-hairpin-helix domain-containing protein [Candidatus Helarchaeota archaeon]